ncbi:squalene-hopene/tetraprenyl-beta-curcumene cyclase [Neorhodopirellula lusitana]|uniref:Squalene-hopene/tetraprenyl-beta-curcumene cyclase n=1 Tax=Neorhodopirellula lusitana TaxID=445327 RepID=A0ABY1QN96_9BACT|nr:prenyltransferase/squalene oxidase repeat-containing protein [Neorhodopirellula lusitana]SMP73312.1 squalene-hopene/tetraprenyl-beta-curcumene cyclase [Neorhodopirellula lusitana]
MTQRRNFRQPRCVFVLAVSLLPMATAVNSIPANAQEKSAAVTSPAISQAASEQRQQIVAKAMSFLSKEGQSDAGTFSDRVGSGVTALAVTAALKNGHAVDEPMVAAGLKALEGYVKPDGGIYGNGRLKNYETCVAMVCFAEANQSGRYTKTLRDAKHFVTEMQYGEAQLDPSNPDGHPEWYGGVGYGGPGRPDLSNTGYMIEALRAAETEASDPAIQRALAFVSRCQNLDSKFNDTQFAAKVNDGGFYYEIPLTKIDPSTSDERYTANGGLRSYGSMSYTGLKSMIFAGLTSEDPRVKAAVQWITDHYDLDQNPGMGNAGLYYYYHTFAAGLDAAGIDKLKDADGVEHDWRAELISELASRQNEDGSWSNENGRWFENDKNLATTLALMSLAHCQ